MKKIIKKGQEAIFVGRKGGDERIFFIFFLSLVSFSDLRKSDRRFSSGLKAKLIYAMRATWTLKSWSFDKLREVGVLSYLKLHFV